MIQNDAELEVVRSQLGRIERALAGLRRDIFPLNAARYQVMAEPYLAQIAELRAELDLYSDTSGNDRASGIAVRSRGPETA